jgi:hypothetical protein
MYVRQREEIQALLRRKQGGGLAVSTVQCRGVDGTG